MAEAQSETQPLLAHEDVVVWPIIHMIRGDVIVCFFRPSSELFTNTYTITALHRQVEFSAIVLY
ncbi:hypothetical protein BDR05DRAFT_687799 [Suillus weaverae]|nr:hypothetical protein BDR05DRAFT_687799 [Suillus weaverae]